MSVVMTGQELKEYYGDKDAWPEGAYHDDTIILIDGKQTESVDTDTLSPGAVVEIRDGLVYLPDGHDIDFVEHAQKWKDKRDGVYGHFYAPKEKHAAVVAAIRAAGGRMIEG